MIGVEEEERSGPGERHATPAAAVTAALTRAFGALPDPVRVTAPLYVLCGGYTRFAAHRFTGRCHDTRRLRPSDSIALEAAELIRPYTTAAGHRGDCFLMDGEDAVWSALSGALEQGPFVECRITVTAPTLPVPACRVSATVRRADTGEVPA